MSGRILTGRIQCRLRGITNEQHYAKTEISDMLAEDHSMRNYSKGDIMMVMSRGAHNITLVGNVILYFFGKR